MPIRRSKASQGQNPSAHHVMPTLEEFLKERGIKSLGDIDARYERLPSSVVELTAAERKLLKDPEWIDEDEADLILAIRTEREEGHLARPFREYLKERGVKVKD